MRKWVSRKPLVATAFAFLLSSLAEPTFAASYFVKQDDTFYKIARERNVSLESLLAANKSVDPLNLQVGQAIQLPDGGSSAAYAQVSNQAPVVAAYTLASTSAGEAAAQHAEQESPSAPAAPVKAAVAAAKHTVTTASGKQVTYSKVLSCVASAYTASPEENGGWAGIDYMGNPLKVGTIAVDPKVIPLGSTVYISGYKHGSLPAQGMIAKATDIGGAIKGARVDIFVPGKDASAFGLQNVKIYVLK